MMKLKFPWYEDAHRILDYYLYQDKMAFFRFRDMANIFHFQYRKISIKDVEAALNQGDNELLELRTAVPSFYYLMGYDYWLNSIKANLLNQEDNVISVSNSALTVPFSPIFDIEMRIAAPHIYETSVWKWEQRYIKH